MTRVPTNTSSSPSTALDLPLELGSDGLRRLLDVAMEYLGPHLDAIPDLPADGTLPPEETAELVRAVRSEMPEGGEPLEEILDLFFHRAVPASFTTVSPGYLAYIPGGGIPACAVADLVADIVNRYMGVYAGAPALAEIEADVLRWFARMLGYPDSARGLLTTGGSLASWSGIVTARSERLGERFLDGVVYCSDQVHHAVVRAAHLAGLPRANVRSLPADSRFRLDPERVAEAVAQDRRRGLTPFLVAASAGTTNTGAVDPLAELADLAEAENLWLHVDAAYGGFFAMTERGGRTLAGIERADSIVLDPHKGLFLPYGTGALLVRDGAALRRTHSHDADYLPTLQEDDEHVDFCEIGPELSRPFRGIRVWLPMKLHGAAAFRDALDEKLDLAAHAARVLRTMPGIELVAPPELSVLAFRLRPPGVEDEAELERVNRELKARVNAVNRVHLTGTKVDRRWVNRIAILCFRTHREHVDAGLEDIRRAAEQLLA